MVNVKAYFREAERLEREMGQSSARRNQQQVTASRCQKQTNRAFVCEVLVSGCKVYRLAPPGNS
jgi:hypothetical protein